ncbi:MAG: ABC transporter permease, partial [Trebonia sp.]
MSDSSPTAERRHKFSLKLDRLSGVYLWALIIVTFSLWKPGLFLTMATVHQIASQQAVIGIMAIGLLVPLTAGTFDLSIGAVANLSTVVVVVLQTNEHYSIPVSIVVAVAISAAIGLVNGLVVVKFGVSSFIVTLGMATIATAVQTIVAGGNQPYPPTSSAWSALTNTQVFGFNIIIVYLIVLALLFWWVLDHTPAGRYLYAIGGNPEATRLSGGRVGLWVWASLVISSTLAGVAGVLYAYNFGSVSADRF